ncbi:MAG TPA: hypothetical protein VF168_09470 [Trueperaceae bacterium]
MESVLEEFEAEVEDLRTRLRAGRFTGSDGTVAVEQADELVSDYRAMLEAESEPSRGRELLDRFREEVARL